MDKSVFFDEIRGYFTLTQQNVRGFDFILDYAERTKTELDSLAYILATTWHETAATMMPIAEYGKGRGRKYGKPGKYGQVPYGRGYVQLTWDFNYERADRELGLGGRLLKNFDLAMNPDIAVKILFKGMKEGWFTGKALDDYLDHVDESDKEDLREFANARRIINGTDKQILIGNHALKFEKALRKAGYGLTATEKPVESVSEDSGILEPVKEKPSVEAPVSKTEVSVFSLIVEFLKLIFRR